MATKVFYWIHPESESVGKCYSREELEHTLDSDPCVEEVDFHTYIQRKKDWSDNELA